MIGDKRTLTCVFDDRAEHESMLCRVFTSTWSDGQILVHEATVYRRHRPGHDFGDGECTRLLLDKSTSHADAIRHAVAFHDAAVKRAFAAIEASS